MNQGPHFTFHWSKFVEHCTTSDIMSSFHYQLQLICVSHEDDVSFDFNFQLMWTMNSQTQCFFGLTSGCQGCQFTDWWDGALALCRWWTQIHLLQNLYKQDIKLWFFCHSNHYHSFKFLVLIKTTKMSYLIGPKKFQLLAVVGKGKISVSHIKHKIYILLTKLGQATETEAFALDR